MAVDGHNHIDKTAPPRERTVKTALLLTILQRSVENQKLNINVDDSVSELATVSTSAIVLEQINNIDRLLQYHSIYAANYDSDYDDYNDNCVATIAYKIETRELEPVNLDIGVGNTGTKLFVDSGSVCTIIKKSLANTVVSECDRSY